METRAREPFILVDLPLSRQFLLSVCQAEGLSPQVAHRTRTLEMVFGMVANGLGVSVLVTRRASDRAYDGKRLVFKPLFRARVRQRIVIAWPEWSPLTAPAQALAACIRSEVADPAVSLVLKLTIANRSLFGISRPPPL